MLELRSAGITNSFVRLRLLVRSRFRADYIHASSARVASIGATALLSQRSPRRSSVA
jgi:hypothetical protein